MPTILCRAIGPERTRKEKNQMSKARETARRIKAEADRLGWTFTRVQHTGGCVVTIQKRIARTPEAFVQADGEYYSILGMIPRTQPGSDWGTDGGGVGGVSAMNSGVFTMNRSGCSKLVCKALRSLVNLPG